MPMSHADAPGRVLAQGEEGLVCVHRHPDEIAVSAPERLLELRTAVADHVERGEPAVGTMDRDGGTVRPAAVPGFVEPSALAVGEVVEAGNAAQREGQHQVHSPRAGGSESDLYVRRGA